jgi:hypothetical protein
MVSISIKRHHERERFEGRTDYYDRGPAKNRDWHFCRVIQKAVPELRATTPSDPIQWKDFAWLTLVIGSGCVQLTDSSKEKLRGLKSAINLRVDQLLQAEKEQRIQAIGTDEGENIDGAMIAARFADTLVQDRVQPGESSSSTADEGADFSDLTARLILLSALLTNFYFNTKAASSQPLGRPTTDLDDLDEAVLPTAADAGFIGVNSRMTQLLAKQCQWHCQEARNVLEPSESAIVTPEVREAICGLLKDVEEGLGGGGKLGAPPRLKRMNLRLVTEVSWYFVMREVGDYSGWSEMLFSLMLKKVTARISNTRPHLSFLRHLSEMVEGLMLDASRKSWTVSRDEETTQDFFGAAARTLWQQSSVIQEVATQRPTQNANQPADGVPPPATAFVTGFDLELEMALWRNAEKGSSFFVVVPVHVFQGRDDDMAQPCWIRGEVVKASDGASFDDLRSPENWELLTANTSGSELRRGPHVVHLSGAPLITLPTDPDEMREIVQSLSPNISRSDVRNELTIEHAIIADEYLAVRHAEVDLFFQFYGEKDSTTRVDRSLPRLLTSSSNDRIPTRGANPRFWMVVGVALGDPAIRYRLVSQLNLGKATGTRDFATVIAPASTSSGNGAPTGVDAGPSNDPFALLAPAASVEATDDGAPEEGSEAPEDGSGRFTGIIVNRRITDDEASLLYWMGFDVIRDSAASFTTDLDHYALHLSAGGRKGWPPQGGDCPLVDEGVA